MHVLTVHAVMQSWLALIVSLCLRWYIAPLQQLLVLLSLERSWTWWDAIKHHVRHAWFCLHCAVIYPTLCYAREYLSNPSDCICMIKSSQTKLHRQELTTRELYIRIVKCCVSIIYNGASRWRQRIICMLNTLLFIELAWRCNCLLQLTCLPIYSMPNNY